MTFYHDPTHKSAMVWVFLDSKENGRDVRSVSVMGGAYTLRDDWGLSLWRDRARSVWDELVRDGWVCHAYGSTGHPR